MTVSEGSPTHSPRRVVPYFYRYFGSIVSKTTRIVFKKDVFSYMSWASVRESVRTRDVGWSFRHSTRITHLLEYVFTLEHCICT